ncbi:hypothetical protein GCM10010407_14750 [Rarobacter incanus]
MIIAVQGAAWSWAIVVVPAVAAFVTAATQVTTQSSWSAAVRVGSALWLLAHGGQVSVGDASISLMPLGLTALIAGTCALSARRSAHKRWQSWVAATAFYVLIVAIAALAIGSSLARVLPVTAVAAATGTLFGMTTGRDSETMRATLRAWWSKVPAQVKEQRGVAAGMRAAGIAVALWALVGACMVTMWAFAGRGSAVDILASLAPDTLGGLVLGVAQTGFAPTFIVWAMAWVSGAAFQVGAGSAFSPGHAVLDPLPAVPLVSALPTGGMTGAWATWVPATLIVVGAVAGISVWKTLRRGPATDDPPAGVSIRDLAVAVGTCIVTLAFATSIMQGLATGSIGPGILATTGAHGGAVIGGLSWRIGVGMAAALVCMHPWPRAQLAALWRASARATGLASLDPKKR